MVGVWGLLNTERTGVERYLQGVPADKADTVSTRLSLCSCVISACSLIIPAHLWFARAVSVRPSAAGGGNVDLLNNRVRYSVCVFVTPHVHAASALSVPTAVG